LLTLVFVEPELCINVAYFQLFDDAVKICVFVVTENAVEVIDEAALWLNEIVQEDVWFLE
jgi:hypothetical protein